MPDDPFAGNAIKAFVGKATDKQIFENSQSGGIVSALLVHALETGKITGAVTVSMLSGAPPRPVLKIAKTREEILGSQRSKYCPVPILGFLKDLKNHDGTLAVVGTSCQIHGLLNVLDKKPELKPKIAFTIGLVCERVLTYSAIDFLIKKAKNTKKDSAGILIFKDKSVSGYPGDVHFLSDDGISVVLPAKKRMQIKDYFTPVRCRLCFDKMNVFSDLTVGDPHGLDEIDRIHGESILVTRSQTGQRIVSFATNAGAINIRHADYSQILKGQKIDQKKAQWKGYSLAWQQSGNKLPDFFALIEKHVEACPNVAKYDKDMNNSIRLDAFPSREELNLFVEKEIQKKMMLQKILFPLRMTKKILTTLKN